MDKPSTLRFTGVPETSIFFRPTSYKWTWWDEWHGGFLHRCLGAGWRRNSEETFLQRKCLVDLPPPNCTFPVGGFNMVSTHLKNMIVKMGLSSPNRGEHKKYLKPPPSLQNTPWRDPGSPKLRIVMKLRRWLDILNSSSENMTIDA